MKSTTFYWACLPWCNSVIQLCSLSFAKLSTLHSSSLQKQYYYCFLVGDLDSVLIRPRVPNFQLYSYAGAITTTMSIKIGYQRAWGQSRKTVSRSNYFSFFVKNSVKTVPFGMLSLYCCCLGIVVGFKGLTADQSQLSLNEPSSTNIYSTVSATTTTHMASAAQAYVGIS
jgi:hypothetical protein